jgi:hypothetical protein
VRCGVGVRGAWRLLLLLCVACAVEDAAAACVVELGWRACCVIAGGGRAVCNRRSGRVVAACAGVK